MAILFPFNLTLMTVEISVNKIGDRSVGILGFLMKKLIVNHILVVKFSTSIQRSIIL